MAALFQNHQPAAAAGLSTVVPVKIHLTPPFHLSGSNWTHEEFTKLYSFVVAQFSPLCQTASLPGTIFRSLDQIAQGHLCICLKHQFHENHIIVRDANRVDLYIVGANDFFQTAPSSFFFNHPSERVPIFGIKVEGEKTSAKPKIPRPPNAYILYRKHNHSLVKAAYPGIHNNQISVILGKKWHAETAEVRARYKNLADIAKQRHEEKYPTYRYTPRKSNDVKRRKKRNVVNTANMSPAIVSQDTTASATMIPSAASRGAGSPPGMSPGAGVTMNQSITMPMAPEVFDEFNWDETSATTDAAFGTVSNFINPEVLGLSDAQLTTASTYPNDVFNDI